MTFNSALSSYDAARVCSNKSLGWLLNSVVVDVASESNLLLVETVTLHEFIWMNYGP